MDRVAVGLPGSAVFDRAKPGVESAAPDVYTALPPVNSNALFRTGESLGLAPGFFGDDVASLEIDTEPKPYTYFSIDANSASAASGAAHPGNILISTGNGAFSVFAPFSSMGLDAGDDLDGLVLFDLVNPGRLDPRRDMALFSLSPFSSSTFTSRGGTYAPGAKGALSPADILYTDFTGTFSLWASAKSIGLRADDNVDALDTVLPEPGTWLLFAGGLAVLAICARRRKEQEV